ncbi:hypothetical protein IE81DRAFT_323877 [Ceraceosorus guamensis]|uniref:Uncharacterized protein n=1 Tax=Ceraceosorus guamensis TaxID=1522189 RepID=A0A316VXL6_9BASI|nr:hypothetical protein IE81DRAFT_323877 [Ceraceosorus guamensis]PWN42054.1 hypothetical protein IE81DRAFT_323877 [Ceraceosorus guamensis]
MASSSTAGQDPQLADIPDPEPDMDGDEDADELGDASGQNAKATKAKGLSRVPAVRALVGKLVHNAKLEISSLHVHSLTKTGFSAKGKARLSAIGTGPLPLVKVKVRLPEATSKLYWVENDASGTIGKRASKDKSGSANAGGAGHIYIANAHIQPFRIKPSAAPGTATADLDLTVSFQPGEEEREGAGLAKVIKHILISPMDAKIRLVMHANGAEVKAYGMRFSGLDVEKEVIVGGLGALGGLLRYGAASLENGRASGDIKPVPSALGVPSGRSESASSSDQHTGSCDPVGEGAKAKKRFTWRSSLSKKSSPGPNSSFDSPSRSSSATTAPTRGSSFRSSSKPQAARTASSASSMGSPALEISDFQIVGGHEQRGIEVEASVTLTNPSASPAITIEPGELRFSLCASAFAPGEARPAAGHEPAASPAHSLAGLVVLGDLTLAATPLKPGPNTVKARGYIRLPAEPSQDAPPGSPSAQAYAAGQRMITSLLQNEAIHACAVAGSTGASDTPWLAQALAGARIDAVVPPLGEKARLLDGAELRVEGTGSSASSVRQRTASHVSNLDSPNLGLKAPPSPHSPYFESSQDSAFGGQSALGRRKSAASLAGGSSVARATLRNGFGVEIAVSSLSVLAVPAAAGGAGLEALQLGEIKTSKRWEGLVLPPGGSPVNASLPFQINRDPVALVTIMRRSAQSRGVDIGDSLEELFEELTMNGGKTPHASARNSKDLSAGGHASGEEDPSKDLASLLARALADLRVTAHVEATAMLGQYRLPGTLRFTQHSLPIALSHTTSAALLPDVGAPFVKTLVDRAEVKLNGIDVHDMDEDGIMLSTGLRLTNFGPLAASILFNGPAELFTVAGEQNGASGGLKPGQSKNRVARLHILDRVDVNPKLLQSVKTNARISQPGGAGGTEAFASFVRAFLLESSTEFELVAKVLVTAGGIDFQATLQKRIVLQGLGGFQGLRVENFSVLGEAFAPAVGGSLTHAAAPTENTRSGRGALQVCASVVLPNPSDISLTLSRLELALTYQGAGIGQLAIEDIIMEAYAETQLEARGLVYIESANYEESLQKLGEMINALLLGKEVKLGIQGERAWVQPSKQSGSSGNIVSLAAPAARPRAGTTSEPSRIPWLDAALRGFRAEAPVRQPPLKIVDQVSVGHIDASFPRGGSPVISTTNIAVKYSVPGYPIGVKVLSASADVELVFNGVVVGRAKTADGTISEAKESNSDEGASGSFKLTLESFELHTKDEATMSELVFHMFEAGPEGTKRISLRGRASIRAYTCIGELPLTVELGQEHLISIAGFNGLQSSPVQYSGFEIKDACAEYLEVRFNLFLNNPSQVHLRLPDSGLSMGVYFRDTYVGRALVSETSFDLPTGPVAVQNVEFRYAPSEEGPVRAIPSNILSGKQSVLQVKGDRQSVQIPVLVPAIEHIRLEFALKPVLNELLESISVHITPTVLTHSTIETAYIIKNPLGVSIDLLSLSFAAHFKSKPFGSASRDMSKAPLRIAPGTSRNPGKQQGKIDCRLAQSLDKIVKTFLQERGTLVLDVEVEARVSLNGFVIPTFEYSQRLPLHVDGLGGVSRILGMIG